MGLIMELQAFLSALEERIARFDLLCHPYYQAWTAGQLTREDLREYASDYYHHVAAFPAYLSALHSRLDDGELRRAVLRNLCDEEIGGRAIASCGSTSPKAWALSASKCGSTSRCRRCAS